jgi:uncharacterized membrane protein YeaQ/YmgE (transglycosylase-associated protein family)
LRIGSKSESCFARSPDEVVSNDRRRPSSHRRETYRSGSAPAAGHLPFFASVRNLSVVIILVIVILALLLAGSLIGLAFSLFWLALTGLVIGALGQLVLPGRHDLTLVATVLIGIAASLLGGILANLFDVGWLIQFLVAVALAALGITLFASEQRRRLT